jgi:hypothetical protein
MTGLIRKYISVMTSGASFESQICRGFRSDTAEIYLGMTLIRKLRDMHGAPCRVLVICNELGVHGY